MEGILISSLIVFSIGVIFAVALSLINRKYLSFPQDDIVMMIAGVAGIIILVLLAILIIPSFLSNKDYSIWIINGVATKGGQGWMMGIFVSLMIAVFAYFLIILISNMLLKIIYLFSVPVTLDVASRKNNTERVIRWKEELFDFIEIKPAWMTKYSNNPYQAKARRSIDKITDQAKLLEIVKRAPNPLTRGYAVHRLTDQLILTDLAKTDRHNDVRQVAFLNIKDENLRNEIKSFWAEGEYKIIK